MITNFSFLADKFGDQELSAERHKSMGAPEG